MARWRKCSILEYRGRRETTYSVCFWNPETQSRRVIRSFKTKHLAKAFAHEYELFLNGQGSNPTTSRTKQSSRPRRLWSESVGLWLESGATREKTRHDYHLVLNKFAKHSRVVCVEDVTEQHISKFLSDLKRKGRSLATCANYLRVIAAFVRCVRPDDPPVSSKLIKRWTPYKQRKRARPHYFTKQEYTKLIRAAGKVEQSRKEQRNAIWWKAFISILYHGGLRCSEAAHLIWQDIDFKKGILQIQPHTGLEGVFDWRPKGKARRAVPVPKTVINQLRQIQRSQPDGVPYVFLTNYRYQHLKNNGPVKQLLYSVDAGFRDIRDSAGISEGTIHDMRRTCITNWAKQQGLTPKDVQVLAGHQDLNTTFEIYAMVEDEDVVEKARKIVHKRKS